MGHDGVQGTDLINLKTGLSYFLNSKTGLFEIDPFEKFIKTLKFRNKEVLKFHFKISSFVNSTAKWDKYVKTS